MPNHSKPKPIPLGPQAVKLGAEFTRDLNDSKLENPRNTGSIPSNFPTQNHLKGDVKSDAKLRSLRSERYINSILFKLLAKRDHTQQELRTKLEALGYEQIEIEQALNQAMQQGFINDNRFAENYIRQRSQRGYGPIRIQMELEAKGIDVSIILPFLSDKAFWENLATIVREKRFGKMIPKDYAEKAKQMRFLQYRGFMVEQISQQFFHSHEET